NPARSREGKRHRIVETFMGRSSLTRGSALASRAVKKRPENDEKIQGWRGFTDGPGSAGKLDVNPLYPKANSKGDVAWPSPGPRKAGSPSPSARCRNIRTRRRW